MSERSLIQVLLLLQRVAAKSGTRSEGGECSIKIRLVSAHYLSQWRKGQRFLVCFFGDICRTFMYFGISSTCSCCWICWASWTKGSKKSFPWKNSWLTLISSHNGEKVRYIFFGGDRGGWETGISTTVVVIITLVTNFHFEFELKIWFVGKEISCKMFDILRVTLTLKLLLTFQNS